MGAAISEQFVRDNRPDRNDWRFREWKLIKLFGPRALRPGANLLIGSHSPSSAPRAGGRKAARSPNFASVVAAHTRKTLRAASLTLVRSQYAARSMESFSSSGRRRDSCLVGPFGMLAIL